MRAKRIIINIFRKNWYKKVGDWIHYACRVQNVWLPAAAYYEIMSTSKKQQDCFFNYFDNKRIKRSETSPLNEDFIFSHGQNYVRLSEFVSLELSERKS